jgi:hypothetical protein
MQAAMARLGGTSFVISAGAGSWKLETRDGVAMDGEASEHVREAVPVLAVRDGSHPCLRLGHRSGPTRGPKFRRWSPLANRSELESAAISCQALGD